MNIYCRLLIGTQYFIRLYKYISRMDFSLQRRIFKNSISPVSAFIICIKLFISLIPVYLDYAWRVLTTVH
jgi:hypothetical protein